MLVYESGLHRVEADAPAAVDRRRRTGRDGRRRGVGARDLRLLAAGRPGRPRLPGRGADRSVRQHQLHRHRPLRGARRCGCPAPGVRPRSRRRPARCSIMMRQNGPLPSSSGATSGRRSASATGPADRERLGLRGRGPSGGHHRPRRAATRSRDLRADDDGAARRRHRRAGAAPATGWPLTVARRRSDARRPPTAPSWPRSGRCRRHERPVVRLRGPAGRGRVRRRRRSRGSATRSTGSRRAGCS